VEVLANAATALGVRATDVTRAAARVAVICESAAGAEERGHPCGHGRTENPERVAARNGPRQRPAQLIEALIVHF
jgi:hypothetical protein